LGENQFVCSDCQKIFTEQTQVKNCTCGGLLLIKKSKKVLKEDWIDADNLTMWKFSRALSVHQKWRVWEKISLGEGNTPFEELDKDNQHIYLKLENTLPSQSYMDRCSALLITKLKEQEIKKIILTDEKCENPSIAKYAKQAQIPIEVFKSESASNISVDVNKNNGTVLDHEAAQEKHHFIMSDYHPYLMEGAQTYAYEIWEQFGHQEPDIVVFPIESSLLAIGAYYGFKDLLSNHFIKKIPKFILVSILSSQSIKTPSSLYNEVLKIIQQTDGHMQKITKTEIVQAGKALLMRGHFTDEQSAAAYAGCMRYYRDHSIKNESMVIPLCNSSVRSKSEWMG
jgi:threonine synthase